MSRFADRVGSADCITVRRQETSHLWVIPAQRRGDPESGGLDSMHCLDPACAEMTETELVRASLIISVFLIAPSVGTAPKMFSRRACAAFP